MKTIFSVPKALTSVCISLTITACSQYVFAPPVFPQDYWTKQDYSIEMVKTADAQCRRMVTQKRFESHAACMLENGFKYLDPRHICNDVRFDKELDCQARIKIR
jgi:hypothetical protein